MLENLIGQKCYVVVCLSDYTMDGGSSPAAYYGVVENVGEDFIILNCNVKENIRMFTRYRKTDKTDVKIYINKKYITELMGW